jgi:hypothetical protein
MKPTTATLASWDSFRQDLEAALALATEGCYAELARLETTLLEQVTALRQEPLRAQGAIPSDIRDLCLKLQRVSGKLFEVLRHRAVVLGGLLQVTRGLESGYDCAGRLPRGSGLRLRQEG